MSETWVALEKTEFKFLQGGPVWPIADDESGVWVAVAETEARAREIVAAHNADAALREALQEIADSPHGTLHCTLREIALSALRSPATGEAQ